MIPGGPFGQEFGKPEVDGRWLGAAQVFALSLSALLLPATEPFLNHDFPNPQSVAPRWQAPSYELGATALTLPAPQPALNRDFPIPLAYRQPTVSYAAGETTLTLTAPLIYAVSTPITNATIGVASMLVNDRVVVIPPSF